MKWTTIANAYVNDSSWVPIKGRYSFADPMSRLYLAVETENESANILLDELTISTITPPPHDQAGLSMSFEHSSAEGWQPKMGNEQVTASTAAARSGSQSLKIGDRSAPSDGASLDITNSVGSDKQYEFSLWAKLEEGAERDELKLGLQLSDQENTDYVTLIENVEVTGEDWVHLSTNYRMNTPVTDISLLLETKNGSAAVFIDDFQLKYVPPLVIQHEIPSLYQVLQEHFPLGIGAAVEPLQLSGEHGELLKKHFNSIVPVNDLKAEWIQPTEGDFRFENADRLVEFAREHGMSVRGHTLVWHQRTPDWFFTDSEGRDMEEETDPVKRAANKALLLQRLETHIKTVVEHFGEDIYAYDVVNEPIDDFGGYRESKWYRIAGLDYIREAFRYARMYAPHAKLYINEYNTESPSKREDLYELVNQLLSEGVPIDGVGHQMHINIKSPSVEEMGNAVELFGELGLDNQITELDMSVYTNDSENYEVVPQELIDWQGYRYKEVIQELIQHKQYISSVVFWGLADDHTWLNTFPVKRNEAPLLFDEYLQAKPAYWGMVDPTKLPYLEDGVPVQ